MCIVGGGGLDPLFLHNSEVKNKLDLVSDTKKAFFNEKHFTLVQTKIYFQCLDLFTFVREKDYFPIAFFAIFHQNIKIVS